MTAQTFEFQRYPAEQARRLLAQPAWGRRSGFSFLGAVFLIFAGASFWTFEPRGTPVALIAVGLGLLVFSVVSLGIWFWRALHSQEGRPWGRLLAATLMAAWLLGYTASQQRWVDVASNLNALQWAVAIALFARAAWLAQRRAPEAEAAIWAAGAAGEELVARELDLLSDNHIVIHSLPLASAGDADHVVVGPAGVVVIETKYLAGRIACIGDGRWIQTRRDGARQIADPAAELQRAVLAVQDRLERRGLVDVPVRCVLVLAHPRAELDVRKSPVPVVRPGELVPLLERTSQLEALLDGRSIGTVANVLLNGSPKMLTQVPVHHGGQALVEFACALVVLLVLAFGLFGVARVTGELLGLTAVAREAARAGARAPDQATALAWASDRGQQVAVEYGLANIGLDIDVSSFEVQPSAGVLLPGEIRVAASATVDLSDVPLVSWAQVQVPLVRKFAEVVDPYRSAPPPTNGSGA